MTTLINRLSSGENPVMLEPRIEDNLLIKKRIEDGFIFIKFIETKGGTELGVNLDHTKCSFETADFLAASGTITLIGTCSLDGVRVRCYAKVDLKTKKGIGHLESITRFD